MEKLNILDCDKINYNPERRRCPICGSEDTYDIIIMNEEIVYLFYRRFAYGKEMFLCKNHFNQCKYFDNWVYKIIRLLSKFI